MRSDAAPSVESFDIERHYRRPLPNQQEPPDVFYNVTDNMIRKACVL